MLVGMHIIEKKKKKLYIDSPSTEVEGAALMEMFSTMLSNI